MVRALIVVDVQNDFCAGGHLAVPNGELVIPRVNDLMRSGQYDVIVFTQDWHPPDHTSFADNHPSAKPFDSIDLEYGSQTLWPTHCMAGSRGAMFHPALATTLAHAVIRKGMNRHVDSYSGFLENDRMTPTGMGGYLLTRSVTHVDVCGLALDYCVKFTAIDSARMGFQTRILVKACRAIEENVDPEAWAHEHDGLTIAE